MSDAFPPIHMLLPHASPMILLDAVQSFCAPHIVCATTARAQGCFGDGEHVVSSIALEWMAQAAAAYATLNTASTTACKQGYLIAIKDWVMHVPYWNNNEHVWVHATHVFGDAHLGQFVCDVRDAEHNVKAKATLNVFVPSEELL